MILTLFDNFLNPFYFHDWWILAAFILDQFFMQSNVKTEVDILNPCAVHIACGGPNNLIGENDFLPKTDAPS